MHEFQIIRQFFDRPLTDSSVRVGVGDDGAIMSPDPGRDIVVVVDTLIEGVHFPLGTAPGDAGYRALAVNLSDIAAMGARPRWMTLSLSLDGASKSWIQGFASGLFEAAREFGVSLVGGDTTRGQQKVISIQLIGDTAPGKVLSRSGASPGDILFVSGTLGDAARGLALMGDTVAASDESRYLQQRFARPQARVSLGQALPGIASAAIDISDGLYSDITKLLDMSKLAARIETSSIPLSRQLRSLAGTGDILDLALSGGDDYELCFTAPPENESSVLALAGKLGVAITRIGELYKGTGLTCTRDGIEIDYSDSGYRHFFGDD